jgi:hypothetical protein
MRFLITIIFSLIFIGLFNVSSTFSQHRVVEVSWERVSFYDSGFISPIDLTLVVENNSAPAAILIDNQAPDQHVAHIRLRDGEPQYRPISAGNGPGEVSGREIAVSLFSDDRIFLWDFGNRRALIVDSTFNSVGLVRNMPSNPPRNLYLANDSTVVSMSNRIDDTLFELYRLQMANESRPKLSDSPILSLSIDAHPSLASSDLAENILLRQSKHRRVGDQLVLGFNFSSITLALSEDGYHWITDEPVGQELPRYDFRDGNTIMAPRANEFPVGTRGIAADDTHVYVLYSDQQARSPGILDSVLGSGIEREMERVMHTDRLFILDRETGGFLHEVKLPRRALAIDIREGFLGLISHEGKEPSIAIYRMPSQW